MYLVLLYLTAIFVRMTTKVFLTMNFKSKTRVYETVARCSLSKTFRVCLAQVYQEQTKHATSNIRSENNFGKPNPKKEISFNEKASTHQARISFYEAWVKFFGCRNSPLFKNTGINRAWQYFWPPTPFCFPTADLGYFLAVGAIVIASMLYQHRHRTACK